MGYGLDYMYWSLALGSTKNSVCLDHLEENVCYIEGNEAGPSSEQGASIHARYLVSRGLVDYTIMDPDTPQIAIPLPHAHGRALTTGCLPDNRK